MRNSVTTKLAMLLAAWRSSLSSSSGPDIGGSPNTDPGPGAAPELESCLLMTRIPTLSVAGMVTLIRRLKSVR